MTADLSALIARLEAVEVGSGELDDRVVTEAHNGQIMDWYDNDPEQHQIKAGDGSRVNVTPVTTSLDSALALAGRVLEGWLWDVTTITTSVGGLRKPLASVVRPDQPEGEEIKTWGYASTPALALCIAILRAKQGEG